MFANRAGSYLQAAQAEDERLFPEWQAKFEEAQRRKEPYRPPLAGFDELTAQIHGLRNDIRATHRMPLLKGPTTPLDLIKSREREISDRRLDIALGYIKT